VVGPVLRRWGKWLLMIMVTRVAFVVARSPTTGPTTSPTGTPTERPSQAPTGLPTRYEDDDDPVNDVTGGEADGCCASPLLVHGFCMQHQVIWCTSIAATDNMLTRCVTLKALILTRVPCPGQRPHHGPHHRALPAAFPAALEVGGE
jgi:hypothetical protein